VVPDLSGSKDVRGLYQRTFGHVRDRRRNRRLGRALPDAGGRGDGDGKSEPLETTVGPENPDNPAYAPAEIAQAVEVAKQSFGDLLVDPNLSHRGSPIVEATSQAGRLTHRGDKLLIVSDGIQASELTGDFHDIDLSDEGVEKLLDKLDAKHLIPDLTGVAVSMPVLLIHPGGIGLDEPRQERVRAFWAAWAKRTGANFDPAPLDAGPELG
jgi:hypothetical protein